MVPVPLQDILSETTDDLEFRDKVIKMSLGFDHLVVATSTQCHIYSTGNWNTPHIFDLKDTVTMILQCQRHFMILDNSTGMQLYTYEGRQLCNPKFQGLRTELLNSQVWTGCGGGECGEEEIGNGKGWKAAHFAVAP